MKILFKNKLILVLFLAFLFRLSIVRYGTLDLDLNTFISWSVNLAGNGFRSFYDGWSDYLPGYLYILWFLGKVRGILPDVLLYKLPAILADVATGYLIYKIVDKIKGPKLATIAASIYLFNPAIWANSTLWGQADSLTAFFAILAVYLIPIAYRKKANAAYYLSAIALAIGTLIKPQAAFALPVILFMVLKKKYKLPQFFTYCFIGLFVFLLGFVPFQNEPSFLNFVIHRLTISFNQYPYTSVNTFNFWGIFGFWRGDSVITQIVGFLVTFIFSFAAGIKFLNKPKSRYVFLSVVFVSTFMFFTRIHERHALPLFAPLTVAAILEPIFFIPLIGFSVTYLLNLYYSFNWITYDFKMVFSSGVTSLLSILNLAFFGVLITAAMDPIFLKNLWARLVKFVTNKQKREVGFTKTKLQAKTVKLLLLIILIFSLGTRVVKLWTPKEMYFDEVYHAFTAKLVLHNDPKAWEWWNAHPEGFAYEWTHPPLAKIFMAGGMKIFGENSFGWRFPGAVLGVGISYLVFAISKKLFRDEGVALLSAAVFALDGLALTISRIGMNDTYFLFFTLFTIYFFLKGKDFWAATTFGLALAAKWSAVWVIPILFIIWLHRKKRFKLSIFWFLFLPIPIYLLTYAQMFLTGHDLGIFWGMQKQMWWYHTGLTATHAYGSSWISWPFMARPVYLYTSEDIGGWVSRIYAIGNPLVFWFGLASVVASAVFAFVERNKKLGLIVFSYLIFFVPWAASPRIMFFYHYLPSIPFLAIATGFVLRKYPKLIFPVLTSYFLLFTYFYPHWVGLQVPLWLDSSYYWFSSWR